MSAMQLKHLFCKGKSVWYTQKSMPHHASPLWKWLIQINEGGTPFNLTIGRYQQEYLKMYPHVPKVFLYVYFFGYSWHTNKKNLLTGTGAG